MHYAIVIVRDADREIREIPIFHRRQVVAMIASILVTEPTRESASRIKRLIQPAASVYRLRVGDYRVFYDVDGRTVTILHVRHKNHSGELYGE